MKTPTKSLTSAVFLAVALLQTSSGDEDVTWPGWLGPERSGEVSHFDVPTDWPEELETVWTAEVGGGYSSPVVAGGRVYLHAREGDEDVVWCLDLASGETIWRQAFEIYFTAGSGGKQHGTGAKSTPAFADGRLFTLSITGVLSAWDGETGKLLWREDFKERFGKNYPYWGVSTSPLVDGDQVLLQVGNDDEGTLIALDVKTGKPVWEYGDAPTSYSSPIVVEIAGVRQVIFMNQPGLVALESGTGRFLWEYAFPQIGNSQNTATPLLQDGLVVIGGEDRGMRCVKPSLVDGKWVAEEMWQQKEVSLDMSTGVINDGLLFGFSDTGGGQFFCLDIASGEVLWKGERRAGKNAAFLSLPGLVVALVNDGELQVLKATGERYEKVRSYRVAKKGDLATWTAPVLLKDSILIKDREDLKLLKLK